MKVRSKCNAHPELTFINKALDATWCADKFLVLTDSATFCQLPAAHIDAFSDLRCCAFEGNPLNMQRSGCATTEWMRRCCDRVLATRTMRMVRWWGC